MEVLSVISSVKKFLSDKLSRGTPSACEDFIYYEIIEYDCNKSLFNLKCANSSRHFKLTTSDLANDECILYQLHPAHACFVGIEYARQLKKNILSEKLINTGQKNRRGILHRYGRYRLLYLDRKNNVCFMCCNTGIEKLMEPRNLVLSNELIQEFDSSEAFSIGLEAGMQISNAISLDHNGIVKKDETSKAPLLRVVK